MCVNESTQKCNFGINGALICSIQNLFNFNLKLKISTTISEKKKEKEKKHTEMGS